MRLLLCTVMAALTLTGCASSDGYERANTGWSNYDYDRPDPSYGGYDPDRYYNERQRHREYRLSENDRVYRGQDDRYYCRRSDGSTGLIVGGIAGGALGNSLSRGGSRTVGTLLGALAGAAVGASIDQNNVRCR